MTMKIPFWMLPAVLFAAIPLSCSSKSEGATYMTRDALLDPNTCAKCHQNHYSDWSGSMHAYASEDPVFRAMNQRGQRETNGQLGTFCVKCHAPMAVQEGATADGLNLDTVPQKLHGVTCFFCHTVESVAGTHNNPLKLASDITMRGEFSDPVANTAHPAAYSTIHDRDQIASATLCGACHDIVSPPGAAIERTYSEWQQSLFSHVDGGETCAQCHMPLIPGLQSIADAPNVFARRVSTHNFAALDSAFTANFPNASANRASVQSLLDTTFQTALCVVQQDGNGAIRVIVDNVAAGHSVTSGSAQDRRLWAEVIAYKGDQVVYQSGVAPTGTPVTSLTNDPDLWLIRDCMFDAQNKPVDMFWQAASVESNLLPFPVTADKTDPRFFQTHIEQYYPRNPMAVLPAMPDKVTLRLLLQPIGLDVLQDLVTSGDLDPTIPAAMPTYVFPEPVLTWTAAAATATTFEGRFPVACVTFGPLAVNADTVTAVNHTKCGF